MSEPNKIQFDLVCEELKYMPLNFTHIARIFGDEFWMLMVICLSNITVKADLDKIQIVINDPKQ